jgi:hypothetical protein
MIAFSEPDRAHQREHLIAARGAEYRAGFMSEAQFYAYLFSMGKRGEDITRTMREYDPPTRRSWEDCRMDESRKWLKDYRNGR